MGVYLFHGWTEKPIKRRRYWKAKLKKREGTNETILFRAFWNRCKHIIFFHSQSFIPHAKAYKDFFLFSNPLNGLGRLQHERYLLVQILVIIQFPSWVESLCFFFSFMYIYFFKSFYTLKSPSTQHNSTTHLNAFHEGNQDCDSTQIRV